MTTSRRNLGIAGACVMVVVAMALLVAFSLPLYRAFCEATGLGGTPRRAASSDGTAARMITVRFNADVAPGLPWRFAPLQPMVVARLGQPTLVKFAAENLSDEAIVAHATYNVTPDLAGSYFNKIQCFCFSEERLAAHTRVEMPVVFFVAPGMAEDPDLASLPDITLSYTFFKSADPDGAKDMARFATLSTGLSPDAAAGRDSFQRDCASCHRLERNGPGPQLAGIFGRQAGTATGFAYSTALSQAGFTWTKPLLERWLAAPRDMVPGTTMPVKIADPAERRQLTEFLAASPPRQAGG